MHKKWYNYESNIYIVIVIERKGNKRAFSNREELIKEILLIRILAEEVIVNFFEMIWEN